MTISGQSETSSACVQELRDTHQKHSQLDCEHDEQLEQNKAT